MTSLLKLVTAMFQPARLLLWKQRFLRKVCNQTFIAKTVLVQEHCFISNPIKTMKLSGCGYRNFHHLIARILISFKLTEQQNLFSRTATFEEELKKVTC